MLLQLFVPATGELYRVGEDGRYTVNDKPEKPRSKYEPGRDTVSSQGLARLRELGPRLAFIDIGLPGLDGYQLARAVRSSSEGAWNGHGPRLVALTGYGQPEDRERALAAGFDRHLTKPVSVAALRQLVDEASHEPVASAPTSPPD